VRKKKDDRSAIISVNQTQEKKDSMQTKHSDNQPEIKNSLPKGLSNPAQRALFGIGITDLRQLSNFSLTEIKKLHGMGPKGIKILIEALEKQNLTFKAE